MQKRILLFCFLLLSLLFVSSPFPVQAPPEDSYELSVGLSDVYVLRGKQLIITVNTNASSFRLEIINSLGNPLYNATRTANMTLTVPSDAVYGTYTVNAKVNGQVSTAKVDVLDITGWSSVSFPYQRSWQTTEYTFFANGSIKAFLTTTNDTLWVDLGVLRELKDLYGLDAFATANSMGFRVRFSKASFMIDVGFAFLYHGCKFIVNGTLDKARDFTFNIPPQKLRSILDGAKIGNLVFDYSDLRKTAHVFNYANGVLTISLPQTFSFDPTIFADGWESGNASAWTGTWTAGSTLSYPIAPVHHGSYAFKVSGLNATTDYGSCYYSIAGLEYYARNYYLWNTSLPTATGSYWLLTPAFVSSSIAGISYPIYNFATSKWGIRYRNGGVWAAVYEVETSVVAADTWYCLELYHNHSDVGTDTLWVNGVQKATVSSDNNDRTLNYVAAGSIGLMVNEASDIAIVVDCFVLDNASYIGPEATSLYYYPTIALTFALNKELTWIFTRYSSTTLSLALTRENSWLIQQANDITVTFTDTMKKTVAWNPHSTIPFAFGVNALFTILSRALQFYGSIALTFALNGLASFAYPGANILNIYSIIPLIYQWWLHAPMPSTLADVALMAEDALALAVAMPIMVLGVCVGLIFMRRRKQEDG